MRVLVYGQSITEQDWWLAVVTNLRERYPHADVIAENRSIGGFEARVLRDTAESDLYPDNPDLLIFHVFDSANMGDLEEILCGVRMRTTADVLILNHHICHVENPAIVDRHDRESEKIRALADKYGFELVDVRSAWREHMESHGLAAEDFLTDVVHLNRDGEALMAHIVERHLRYRPEYRNGSPLVRYYTGGGEEVDAPDRWKCGQTIDRPLRLEFVGSRVDVVTMPTMGGRLGTATVLVDGKKPSEFAGAYASTRPSAAPGSWMPALRRVRLGPESIVEDWTLRFSEIDASATRYVYSVRGSITGLDGGGEEGHSFTSTSGRISIEPSWFQIGLTTELTGIAPTAGFEVTWKVVGNFQDTWRPEVVLDPSREQVQTLASGLENTSHVLELLPNGDGDLPLRWLTVHRPALPA